MKTVAYDVETTELSPWTGGTIFSYALWDIECGNCEVWRLDTTQRERARGIARLQELFDDISIRKVCHNYKFELAHTQAFGIRIPPETAWDDTMLMAQVVRNDELSYGLDYLCRKYGGIRCPEDVDVAEQAKDRGGFQHVDKALMYRYQRNDVYRTALLYRMYSNVLAGDPKMYADYLAEIRVVPALVDMERTGVRIDRRRAEKMVDELDAKLEEYDRRIAEYNGGPLNVNSGDQLAVMLFERLGMSPVKMRAKRPSVDKETIERLQRITKHPVLELLQRRTAASTGAKYLRNYLKHADVDGVIHPNLKSNEAVTGRMSCERPNLQNVGKEATVKSPYAVPLRSVFRAPVGEFLVFADYRGIEMALIADATGEPELLELWREGKDIHHPTVECFLGAAEADRLRRENPAEYKRQRDAYKNTGFCVAYGGGNERVAETLGKPLEEILAGVQNYRRRFPRVADFSRALISQVKRYGYVVSPYGRRLYIAQHVAYTASNALIQHTAACVYKRGLIKVRQVIAEKYSTLARLTLPIHDETVFTCSRRLLPRFAEFQRDVGAAMVDVGTELKVPMRVDWEWSTGTWADAEEVRL